jgi:hypothetical protein
LRPELVKKSRKPLSSDTFTQFGAADKEENEQEIKDAISMLLNEIIPQLAKKLETITDLPANTFSTYFSGF